MEFGNVGKEVSLWRWVILEKGCYRGDWYFVRKEGATVEMGNLEKRVLRWGLVILEKERVPPWSSVIWKKGVPP
jgi:hypothetical protein